MSRGESLISVLIGLPLTLLAFYLLSLISMYETVISTADRVDDPLPFVIPVPSWTSKYTIAKLLPPSCFTNASAFLISIRHVHVRSQSSPHHNGVLAAAQASRVS